MNDLESVENAIRALRDQTPAPRHQQPARVAFLAEARRLREQAAVSTAAPVRHRGWKTGFSILYRKHTGVNTMYQQRHRRWLLVSLILILLLAAGVVVGQEMIRFFNRSAADQGSTDIFYDPNHEPSDPFPLTLEQALQAADFTVKVPAVLPPGYRFDGAFYAPAGRYLSLNYKCGAMRGVSVSQNLVSPEDVQSIEDEVGASAVIEPVTIGDQVGQYVRGMWRVQNNPDLSDSGLEPGTPVPAQTVWENNSEFQRLIWYDDGILYRVETSAGSVTVDGTAGDCALDKDDFAAIARSLQPAN